PPRGAGPRRAPSGASRPPGRACRAACAGTVPGRACCGRPRPAGPTPPDGSRQRSARWTGRRGTQAKGYKEEEPMARLFSIRPALALRGRKFRGIRGWAGKPTHPPLTDFPVVAYVLAAAFDLLSFILGDRRGAHDAFVAATFVIVAGAIVSLATALT